MKKKYNYKIVAVSTEEKKYVFSRQVSCTCEWKDQFFISCEELDILVWGDSHAQAMEAFGFAFESIYECYALEDDSKLSIEAMEVKKQLLELVEEIVKIDK